MFARTYCPVFVVVRILDIFYQVGVKLDINLDWMPGHVYGTHSSIFRPDGLAIAARSCFRLQSGPICSLLIFLRIHLLCQHFFAELVINGKQGYDHKQKDYRQFQSKLDGLHIILLFAQFSSFVLLAAYLQAK